MGLYQLYGQIISYLVLIEGGIGSVLLFRLYKPIAEKDEEKLNSIMAAARVIFNIIGIIIIIVGVIISFNIGLFVDEVVISQKYMKLVFVLFLLSQSINYFFIPYRNMFEADQKRYIPNIIYQSLTIIKTIVEVLILLLGHGLVPMMISLTICSLIANCLIRIIFVKTYKNINFKSKKDFSMLKDVKDLFINTLGNLLTNNIDVIILSKAIGLKYVVIYTTYNYFIEALKQLADKITGATMSVVGKLMIEDKKRTIDIFNDFNCFVFYLGTIIGIPVFLCINQFINLWYENQIYTSLILAILFSIILFYQVIRIPLKVFIFSAGKFKEVKNYVILEIVINLSLSIILVKPLGIVGVLIATIISLFIADFLTKPYLICHKLLGIKTFNYYKKAFLNFTFLFVEGIICYFVFPKVYSSILTCILFGIIIGIVNLIVTTIYFYLTNQLEFVDRFEFLRNIKNKINFFVRNKVKRNKE